MCNHKNNLCGCEVYGLIFILGFAGVILFISLLFSEYVFKKDIIMENLLFLLGLNFVVLICVIILIIIFGVLLAKYENKKEREEKQC